MASAESQAARRTRAIGTARGALEHYRPLIAKCREVEPEEYELAALAALLQSFYNGAENLFKRVLRELGEALRRGEAWHQELLEAASASGEPRPAMISEELFNKLLEYLQFRHVFRGAYLFQLRWNKMKHLVQGIEEIHDRLEEEIFRFMAKMDVR